MPTSRKVKKKNQIPKYYTLSPKEKMKKIRDRLIKNLLILWDIKEENQKILSVFGEKHPNPGRRWERKTGKDQAREKSKISLFA